MQTLISKIRIYYLSLFLFNLARTVPHAILTILLINDKNVSLSEIATIQISYMVAIILFDLPSGIISDLFNRKKIYILSIVTIIISYLLIYYFSDFHILISAWFLYGLSTSLMSGTIDAEIINLIKKNNYNLKTFKVKLTYINSFSSIVGALFGSLLYLKVSTNIYIISVGLFVTSIISILFIQIDDRYNERINIKSNILDLISECKSTLQNKSLNIIILLICLTSLFVQVFYQYWQILYQYKNIPVYLFGYVYTIFNISNIIGAYIFNKINYKNISSYIILVLILIFNVFIIIFFEGAVFFVTFPTILIFYSIYQSYIYFRLNTETPPKVISSLISFVNTLVNISSVIVLIFISILVEKFDISLVYIIFISTFSALSLLASFINRNLK